MKPVSLENCQAIIPEKGEVFIRETILGRKDAIGEGHRKEKRLPQEQQEFTRAGSPQLQQIESNCEAEILKQEADELHKQGYEARRNGQYDEAILLYSKALKKYPNHYRVNRYLINRAILIEALHLTN